MFIKKSSNVQRNRYEEQVWKPRFHQQQFVGHPEETLDNEALQDATRSGHNVRGQAKEQTELTCAVSLAERILNMSEIGYEIHTSLNFSFKFGGIILILFNIKPVLFH